MFEAEARWLSRALARFPVERLSPLLNLGSSDLVFRARTQPWIEAELFRPLAERGVLVTHVDLREGAGIDVQADLTDPADSRRLKARRPQALLCCNILEHVREPEALARNCLDLLEPGGLVFVTVPFSYPHHRDPIDTMLRPDLEALARLFAGARLVEGAILGAGRSYRDDVRRRPWILLRHLARLPVPFLSPAKWRRSMKKLYWLVAPYRITCAVFEKE
jgi:SAM-dependent methyltransferase